MEPESDVHPSSIQYNRCCEKKRFETFDEAAVLRKELRGSEKPPSKVKIVRHGPRRRLEGEWFELRVYQPLRVEEPQETDEKAPKRHQRRSQRKG